MGDLGRGGRATRRRQHRSQQEWLWAARARTNPHPEGNRAQRRAVKKSGGEWRPVFFGGPHTPGQDQLPDEDNADQ